MPSMSSSVDKKTDVSDSNDNELQGLPTSCNVEITRNVVDRDDEADVFDGRTASSTSCTVETTSFDDDVDAVVSRLLEEDPCCPMIISVQGISGIGKTSLAKLIYHNQAIADCFPDRAWFSAATLSTWVDMMQQLMEKKQLIVIDGLCSDELWTRLEDDFTNTSNRTRILLTTTGTWRIPEHTKITKPYTLFLRNDAESWALFKHTLNPHNFPSDTEVENLKEEILRICGGLPKVIVKLARLMSHADAADWPKILEQLTTDDEPWSQILAKINSINSGSYFTLCLFYFLYFPKDHNKISRRRLIALWVAEGLGREQDEKLSPEIVLEECLTALISWNMIQVTERKLNGEIKTCRLPDPLRLHWYSKAKEAQFFPRRLVYPIDQGDALISSSEKVVSFLSFDSREGSSSREDIGNVLVRCISSKSFQHLWVLDLEKMYKPKLPKALCKLIHLRYLGLRSTYLEMLPLFIDKLLNLETLDLKRTYVNTLPNLIWKMHKLRHFFLDESSRITFVAPPEGRSLEDLQTLWGLFVDEQSPVTNGLDKLLNIKKLGLACRITDSSQQELMSEKLKGVAKWVRNLREHLQSLRLKSFNDSCQPWNLYLEPLSRHTNLSSVYLVGKLQNKRLVSEFPNSLIELILSASDLEDDPMKELEKLPNLRIVRLSRGAYGGKKMICSSGGFPKLQVLKFWGLEQLEEWIIEKGALPNLKDLEIRSCINLIMLPDGLRLVRALCELKLTRVPRLSERIMGSHCPDWDKIAHVSRVYNIEKDQMPRTAYHNSEYLL